MGKLLTDATGQAINTSLGSLLAAINGQNANINAWAGALSSLNTSTKSSLVAAINEVLTKANANTSSINALKDIYATLDALSDASNGAGIHNSLYRGKNLGSTPTADQLARINDGTFKGLWLGDYWSKSITYSYLKAPVHATETWRSIEGDDVSTSVTATATMRIGDHDYYRRAGDNIDLLQHHLNIILDGNLYSAPMNKAQAITTGAYALSEMRTKYLAAAESAFAAFFGAAHLLSYRDCLQNAVTDGRASAGAWYDCKVELMDERQVYGGLVFDGGSPDGSTVPNRYTVSTKQFNLFRARPDLISNRQWYWLRNVVSAAAFADVADRGGCDSYSASLAFGVRPAALIY